MIVKKATFLFLILLNINFAYSQFVDFKTMNHIYADWLGRGGNCDTLYYRESVEPTVIDSTIKTLSQKKYFPLSGLYDGNDIKPFVITQVEQTYLIKELTKLKSFKWPAKMFPKSKKIDADKINQVFAITKSYPTRKSNKCSIIYGFSKPIYFRKNTFCLYLNHEQYDLLNSQFNFTFYKLEDKEWVEYADAFINFGSNEIEDNKSDNDIINNKVIDDKIIKVDTELNTTITTIQLDSFAHKIFTAFQKKQIDSLINLIPTFEESQAIHKSNGLSSTRNEELPAHKLLYKELYNNRINRIQKLFTTATEKNVDVSRCNFLKFEKEEQLLNFSSKPFINISLNIFLLFENRKFILKISDIGVVKNTLKIGTGISFVEME